MSEDFDREAEKERLREKLADDQESRKATEHMSDLLLKGATMTNAHCDACGDPIFRYDGQEFCPTCGETVDDEDPASPGSEGVATDEDVASPESDGVATDEDAASPGSEGVASGEGAASPGSEGVATGEGARVDDSERTAGTAASQVSPGGGPAGRGANPTPDAGARERPPEGTLREARASLVRTLSDLAARAEAAEDVRRTRDLLAAAREAGEALAALDRADR
jgi:uncharacterized Zn finger protein (UPF0148 family)